MGFNLGLTEQTVLTLCEDNSWTTFHRSRLVILSKFAFLMNIKIVFFSFFSDLSNSFCIHCFKYTFFTPAGSCRTSQLILIAGRCGLRPRKTKTTIMQTPENSQQTRTTPDGITKIEDRASKCYYQKRLLVIKSLMKKVCHLIDCFDFCWWKGRAIEFTIAENIK